MKQITTNWITDEDGPKVLYSANWRPIVYYCKLSELKKFMEITEKNFEFEGVYILKGEDENQNETIYVGETDNIAKRIRRHVGDEKKASFTETVFICSQTETSPFSKDELHYLERKLIRDFRASEYKVENENSGQGKKMTVFERMLLENDYDLIEFALFSFGFNMKKEIRDLKNNESLVSREKVLIYAETRNEKQRVKGVFNSNNTITILSKQKWKIIPKTNPGDKSEFERMIKIANNTDSILIKKDHPQYEIEILEDITFNSPSTAAIFIKGGGSNGWFTWKTEKDSEPIDFFRKNF